MQDLGFRFADAHFCLAYPDGLAEPVNLLFRNVQSTTQSRNERVIEILQERHTDSYRIISDSRESPLLKGSLHLLEELPFFILEEIGRSLNSGLLLPAAAFSAANKVILFPSLQPTDRIMLSPFLLSHGWRYLTNHCAHKGEDSKWHYLGLPLAIISEYWQQISTLLGGNVESHLAGKRIHHLILEPEVFDTSTAPPSLLVFPRYQEGAEITLTPLSKEQATDEFINCLVRKSELARQVAVDITQKVPVFELNYGDYAQLERLGPALTYIAKTNPSEVELTQLLTSFQLKSTVRVGQHKTVSPELGPAKIPEATPACAKKVMTIGMATYDDYDGVYFTVQAIRLYHPEVTEQTEILVVDNHPDGPAAEDLKNLDKIIANYRYFPYGVWKSPMVKDVVFRQANADYVLCLDGHVMLQPGALKRLIDYFEANPDCSDLLQGPMFAENLNSLHTHFDPVWNKGMYGFWGSDERAADPDGPPFEIPMQGLGLFACRKNAWVGFNPRFRGFGGEEGYLHEKFRQRGGKTLCLPFLKWLHRFSRPGGVPYLINWHDRIFNYMVGCHELGLDSEPVKKHFKEHLGAGVAAEILDDIEKEIRSPFFYFDAIYCITADLDTGSWKKMRRRLQALGINEIVRIYKTDSVSENHRVSFALSHRAILQEALELGLDNVLVIEEETLFLDETLAHLTKSLEELGQREWNLFHLGGQSRKQPNSLAVGCRYLRIPHALTSTHAVAYDRRVFVKILHDLPATAEDMSDWLEDIQGYENYLSQLTQQFMAEPSVTTVTHLLPHEEEIMQKRFLVGETLD